jgi:16S rRNA G527 N7-methylase RsmG
VLLQHTLTPETPSNLQVLMLDALKKRCGFMEAAAEHMGLANVTAVWARAEDAGRDPQFREVFRVYHSTQQSVSSQQPTLLAVSAICDSNGQH